MKLLLDTQAFLYAGFGAEKKIPARAIRELSKERNEIFLSAVTLVEIDRLVRKGVFHMTAKGIDEQLAKYRIKVLPLTFHHASKLLELPDHHPDPFDRMIIATALVEDMRLVGGDEQFIKYKGLKVLWR
jgi:PIN domain nuclease of toxin-antitoxin system